MAPHQGHTSHCSRGEPATGRVLGHRTRGQRSLSTNSARLGVDTHVLAAVGAIQDTVLHAARELADSANLRLLVLSAVEPRLSDPVSKTVHRYQITACLFVPSLLPEVPQMVPRSFMLAA